MTNLPQNFRSRKQRLAIIIASAVAVVLLVIGGWIGYKFISNALKATNGNLFGLLAATKLNGESTGRVNILIAGNSADDPGHGGANLTDSIMIVSLNTTNNSAYMLS